MANCASSTPGHICTSNLEHLTCTSELVRRHGKRVLFWADVASGATLFEKYPQLASGLPEGTIPVPWYYHEAKDFSRMLAPFRQAHVPQIIGTGMWAWDTIVPYFRISFSNVDGFLRDGRRLGAIGIVNSNWADDAQVLYRTTESGVAYGAIAAWQHEPMDRAAFFTNYSAALHGPEAADRIAAALHALDDAQQAMGSAVGAEDMFRLWDDPFSPQVLNRVRGHIQNLRQARLKAEEAQEHLQDIARQYPDSLPSLLLGARLLDYAGMKYLYAVEIADIYNKLDSSASKSDISFWLGREASDRNHSRIADLMDLITELRDVYRAQWEAEYTHTDGAPLWAASTRSTNIGADFGPGYGMCEEPSRKGARFRLSIRFGIEPSRQLWNRNHRATVL